MFDDSNIVLASFNSKPEVKKGRTLALWGACLTLVAVISLLVAITRVIEAYGAIGKGVSATTLVENIAIAISGPTLIGSILSLAGLVFLMVALFKSKYRAPWFFLFMVIYAVLNLTVFPVGTILGTIILTYIIPKKEEFFANQPQMGTASPRPCSTFD